jgi:hypothetical protein
VTDPAGGWVAWPGCSATGVGSLPGVEALAAITSVLDTFPDLPYLPELPARGVGADTVGRTAGLLVDLPVELVVGRWQVAGRPGADLAAAGQMLADDLQAVQIAAHSYSGPLKVAVLGPVSLAASLDRSRGEVAVGDRGLRRDLTSSSAEGVRGLLSEVRQRVPGAVPVLQLDEPWLPAVLAGSLRRRSGWGRLTSLDPHEARGMLAEVLSVGGSTIVHCCASELPVDLVVSAGATAVSFDLDLVSDDALDSYGAAVDAGAHLMVGAVRTTGPGTGTDTGAEVAERVRAFWNRLGFSAETMCHRTVVSPACGLAGNGAYDAQRLSRAAAEAARRLT